MAAALFRIKPIFKTIADHFYNKSIGIVRNSSKKSSRGVSKGDHGRPSHFGLKRQTESFVTSGTILYNQIKLNYMPGLNVGIGKVAKLYAKVPGRVIISCEETNFKPDSLLVQMSFPDYPAAYRKYMNVIPEPRHTRFKLVETF